MIVYSVCHGSGVIAIYEREGDALAYAAYLKVRFPDREGVQVEEHEPLHSLTVEVTEWLRDWVEKADQRLQSPDQLCDTERIK